jgi:hypothetical protein
MTGGLSLERWRLAGWPGGVSPPDRQTLNVRLITNAGASLPVGSEDAAGPAGETPAFRPRTACL